MYKLNILAIFLIFNNLMINTAHKVPYKIKKEVIKKIANLANNHLNPTKKVVPEKLVSRLNQFKSKIESNQIPKNQISSILYLILETLERDIETKHAIMSYNSEFGFNPTNNTNFSCITTPENITRAIYKSFKEAVLNSDFDKIKTFIQEEINPNIPAVTNDTIWKDEQSTGHGLLLAAVISRNPKETISLLLEHNADVNQQYCLGWTPLLFAVDKLQVEAVLCLLEHKANPNISNDQGQTALQIINQKIARRKISDQEETHEILKQYEKEELIKRKLLEYNAK